MERKNPHHHHLCEQLKAHDWGSTAASNYRHCQRFGCRAAQRYEEGRWVEVVPATRALLTDAATQPGLW